MPSRTSRQAAAVLAAAVSASACSSNSLKVLAEPPSVTITEPSVDSQFYEGQDINFVALVEAGNEDDDLTTISHRWVSGNESMCDSEAVGADGYAYCAYAFTDTGEKTVEVTVTDGRGDRAKASTTVLIVDNTPPSIEITAPEDGELFAEDDLIRFDAIVSDFEEDAAELTVSIRSSIDGDLGVTASPASSGDYSAGVYLTAGVHLVTLVAEDSYGQSDQDTVELEVYQDGPPSVDSVTISPSPAYTNDTLLAVPQGWSDLDGAPERYEYVWTVNGTVDVGESTDTYPPGKTAKGDLVQVTITPVNDFGGGDPVGSPTIEIENTAPEAPSIQITPASPEPEDNLQCGVTAASSDGDGDAVSYVYEWLQNGVLTASTSNVIAAADTAHNDTWECVVRGFDGEDYSAEVRTSVTINDGTAPDPPVLDTPERYRNEDSLEITGDCEPACEVTIYCADSTITWTDVETCDSAGEFTYTTSLTRGDTASCQAECTDRAGNTSATSNTVVTEVCDPYDAYEDGSGYGDSGTDPVDEWSSLSDAGTTTIAIEGNILGSDSEDWYVISTTDDVASDYTALIDYYNFEVQLYAGASDYAFLVYKGSPDPSDMECSATYAGTGYTEYSDFVQDTGDGNHAIPSDTRRCGSGSPSYNDCEDRSTDYYIQVFRRSTSTPSCQHFELEITNGVW